MNLFSDYTITWWFSADAESLPLWGIFDSEGNVRNKFFDFSSATLHMILKSLLVGERNIFFTTSFYSNLKVARLALVEIDEGGIEKKN